MEEWSKCNLRSHGNIVQHSSHSSPLPFSSSLCKYYFCEDYQYWRGKARVSATDTTAHHPTSGCPAACSPACTAPWCWPRGRCSRPPRGPPPCRQPGLNRIRKCMAYLFWLEFFSHHRKKITKTFKQRPKTKNSKGGKLIKIAFYGNVQCEW